MDVDWLALGLLTVGLAAALARWSKLWSADSAATLTRPRWWPYGDATWRGWVRAMPTGVVGGTFLVLGGWAGAVAGWSPEGQPMIIAALVLLGFVGLLLCVALMGLIVLYNRPKRVVPPRLRDQPGAVSEWRRDRGAP